MKRSKLIGKFVICIRNEECEDLEPRKLYRVLPDEAAAADGYIRVIDESGEDYLYPTNYFVFVEFPQVVERKLRRVSHPNLQNVSTRQRGATTRQRKPTQRAG